MDNIVIILGAGATTGSGYELKLPDGTNNEIPVDNNFLKVVFKGEIHKQCLSNDPLELLYRSFISLMEEFRITRDEKLISDIGLEEAWNTVVLNRKFLEQNLIHLDVKHLREDWNGQSESPQVKKWKRADYFLRILIQKVYGEMIDYEGINNTDDSYYKLFKRLGLSKKIKNRSSKKVSFLTFNYDLCLENSLWRFSRNKQYFYYPPFDDNYIDEKDMLFPIYKLHGSLNWWHGYDGFIRLKRENILKPIKVIENNYWRETTFDSWEKYQPSIIPADFLKEELFSGEGQQRLHRHYMKLWAEAGTAIEKSDAVIVIGYSFPSADPHARWLMRASQSNLFGKENKSGPKPIFFITKCGRDKNGIINLLGRLFYFKDKPAVCTKGFEECFEDLEKWLNERGNLGK